MLSSRILITGSSGLVGASLRRALPPTTTVECLDLRARGAAHGDVRDARCVEHAVAECDGIVHLAALSRVIWAEQDPRCCWETNVGGLLNVLRAASTSTRRPWLLFASSREVYGQPDTLPANEDSPLQPVNVYGRAKVEGERLVEAARRDGMRAAVVRLSNVYGGAADHQDRVVPAFVHAALAGRPLRVEGASHTFDFTHVDEVARGLAKVVELLQAGETAPPPVHLVSGRATTLAELAAMTLRLARSSSVVEHQPERDFDVARFHGCPYRARSLLGWTHQVSLEEGLARLIEDVRPAVAPHGQVQEAIR